MARSPHLPSSSPNLSNAVLGARSTVQATAFWIGVLLPLAHVPLLLLVDHGRIVDVDVVARLVALNAAACLIGHGHDP